MVYFLNCVVGVIGAGVGFVLEQGQGLAAQVEVIAQRGAVSQRKRGQRKRGQSPFSCALCLGVNMEKNSPATAAPVSTTGRPLLLILIIAEKKEKSTGKRKNAVIDRVRANKDQPRSPTKKALPIGSAGLSVFRAAGDHARILLRDTKRTIAQSPFLPRHPCSLNPSNLKNLFLTP